MWIQRILLNKQFERFIFRLNQWRFGFLHCSYASLSLRSCVSVVALRTLTVCLKWIRHWKRAVAVNSRGQTQSSSSSSGGFLEHLLSSVWRSTTILMFRSYRTDRLTSSFHIPRFSSTGKPEVDWPIGQCNTPNRLRRETYWQRCWFPLLSPV